MSNAIMLTDTTTRRDAAFELFNEGLEVPEAAKRLGVARDSLYPIMRDWKIATNHPDMHHPGKADLIRRQLKGLSGLRIIELFGFKGDGVTPGDMTDGFKDFGDVEAYSKLDGDAIKVLHSLLSEVGESDKKKWDVLAIDGYGLKYGGAFLQRGATSLIKSSGGFLFVSFNLPRMFCSRHRGLQHLGGIHFRTLSPDEGDMSDYVARCCYLYGHVATHLETLRVGSGGEGLLVMVFKLDPMVSEDQRIDLLSEVFDLEK